MAAGRACQLVVFGLTVASVLDDPVWSCAPRNLDVAELWSGVAAVSAAALHCHQRAETFDILDSPDQDICAEFGFRKAVSMVMRVRANGLVAMAPVCSSFCTLNAANTKRCRDNLGGDETYLPVKQGNFMAKAAAFLLCLALARSAHAFLENPASSCLFNFLRPTLSLISGLCFTITDRCCWSAEPFGQRYKKPWKFLSTGPWLAPIAQRCACPSSALSSKPAHLSLVYLDAKGRPCGHRSALRSSGAYPAKLGQALIDAWLAAPPVQVAMAPISHSAASETSPTFPRAGSRARVSGKSRVANCPSKRKLESQDPWPDSSSDTEASWGGAWPEDCQGSASPALWTLAASQDSDSDWGWPADDDGQSAAAAASAGLSEPWAEEAPWPELSDSAAVGSSDSWPW